MVVVLFCQSCGSKEENVHRPGCNRDKCLRCGAGGHKQWSGCTQFDKPVEQLYPNYGHTVFEKWELEDYFQDMYNSADGRRTYMGAGWQKRNMKKYQVQYAKMGQPRPTAPTASHAPTASTSQPGPSKQSSLLSQLAAVGAQSTQSAAGPSTQTQPSVGSSQPSGVANLTGQMQAMQIASAPTGNAYPGPVPPSSWPDPPKQDVVPSDPCAVLPLEDQDKRIQSKNQALDARSTIIPPDREAPPPGLKRTGFRNDSKVYIVTNHLKVKHVPEKLFEYELSVKIPVRKRKEKRSDKKSDGKKPEDDGANGDEYETVEMDVTKRNELKKIFAAAITAGLPALLPTPDEDRWATDLQMLWSMDPYNPKKLPLEFSFRYAQETGKVVIATITLNETPDSPFNLSQDPFDIIDTSQTSSQRIRALNAIIAKQIMNRSAQNVGAVQAATDPIAQHVFQIGANKFFIRNRSIDIGPDVKVDDEWVHNNDFRVVRGYFSSIRPGQKNILLNVNTAHSAFFHAPLEVQYLLRTIKLSWRVVEGLLKGVTVRIKVKRKPPVRSSDDPNAEYVNDINQEPFRLRRFVEILKENAEDVMFYPPGGTARVNWLDWYRNNVLADPREADGLGHLRVVNVGASRRSHDGKRVELFPASHLEVPADQIVSRILPKTQSQEKMIDVARKSPAENLYLISDEGLKALKIDASNSNSHKEFNIDPKLLRIPATKLGAPTIEYPSGNATIRQASWNLLQTHFYKDYNLASLGKRIPVYIIQNDEWNGRLNPSRGALEGALHPLLTDELTKHQIYTDGRDNQEVWYDIQESGPLPSFPAQSSMSFHQATGWVTKKFQAFRKRNPDNLVLVVLGKKDEVLYSALKAVSECHMGFMTICCTWDKIRDHRKWNGTFTGNLALKYWTKLGGNVHHIQGIDSNLKDCLVLGADVVHPSGGSAPGCPSVASVVGSVDDWFVRYPGTVRLQRGRQENIHNLRDMTKERILVWLNAHRRPPTKVLFYRDGVSESQYQSILDQEVPQVRAAWAAARQEWLKRYPAMTLPEQIKLTYVIVGKRHNVRFYPAEERDSYKGGKKGPPTWVAKEKGKISKPTQGTFRGRGPGKKPQNKFEESWESTLNGNLDPGFVVDQVVTHPYCMDFYLQSHQALAGTAKSAHYYVLEDDSKHQPQEIHDITHKLCYAYARATKGVSYCAPAYCADRLCDRARRYLWDWFKGSVSDKNGNTVMESGYDKAQILSEAEWNATTPDPQELFRDRVVQWIESGTPSLSTVQHWPSLATRTNPWTATLENKVLYM